MTLHAESAESGEEPPQCTLLDESENVYQKKNTTNLTTEDHMKEEI